MTLQICGIPPGDEASLPVLGPTFQLLRHVKLEPFSIAAGGIPAPVKIHFEPSSRESKRLVVAAPMNFSFMGYLGLEQKAERMSQIWSILGWCVCVCVCAFFVLA